MSTLDDRLSKYTSESKTCSCKSLTAHKQELEQLGSSHINGNMAQLFKVLADENRIKILFLLKMGPLCMCELEYVLNLKQPTVTHHLKKLRDAGLIIIEKQGKWTVPRLRNEEITQLLVNFHKEISEE
ncbi:MAG: winged helix-turn-helix transcriptional regulator [Candidatus Heimdallarchaeota archaeon]|nr:winged helix-turn-helix transcriptional regulator [Candidatus Heimdallarchaeota archaeon]